MQMSQRPKSHGHMGYQGAQWHPRLTAKYNKYIHGLVRAFLLFSFARYLCLIHCCFVRFCFQVTYRDFARPAGALGAQGYFIISIPFVLYYTTKFLQVRLRLSFCRFVSFCFLCVVCLVVCALFAHLSACFALRAARPCFTRVSGRANAKSCRNGCTATRNWTLARRASCASTLRLALQRQHQRQRRRQSQHRITKQASACARLWIIWL